MVILGIEYLDIDSEMRSGCNILKTFELKWPSKVKSRSHDFKYNISLLLTQKVLIRLSNCPIDLKFCTEVQSP